MKKIIICSAMLLGAISLQAQERGTNHDTRKIDQLNSDTKSAVDASQNSSLKHSHSQSEQKFNSQHGQQNSGNTSGSGTSRHVNDSGRGVIKD